MMSHDSYANYSHVRCRRTVIYLLNNIHLRVSFEYPRSAWDFAIKYFHETRIIRRITHHYVMSIDISVHCVDGGRLLKSEHPTRCTPSCTMWPMRRSATQRCFRLPPYSTWGRSIASVGLNKDTKISSKSNPSIAWRINRILHQCTAYLRVDSIT